MKHIIQSSLCAIPFSKCSSYVSSSQQRCVTLPIIRRKLRHREVTELVHAWKIPWTEGPGGLQSMGSLGVGHDWSNLAAAATHTWKTSHLRLAFLFLPPICSSTEGRLASISVVWVSPQSCQRSGSLDPVAILSSYLLWPVWSTQHWSLLLWCLLLPYHFHSLSGLHASGTVFVLLECPSQLASISGIFFVRWILTFSLLVSH